MWTLGHEKPLPLLFSLPVGMYRKSYCSNPGVGVGIGGGGMNKMLKFNVKFLCYGQGAVSRAILYMDRPCFIAQCISIYRCPIFILFFGYL